MTDAEFVRRFECGEIRSEDFHHREHVRLAWAYLQRSGSIDEACERMRAAIRAFARAAGKPGKYHDTLTVFWVRLIADVSARVAGTPEFESVLPAHAYLLDKDTPLAYYSRERLFSDDARLSWQAPDLRPLATHAALDDSRDPPRGTPAGPVRGGAPRRRAVAR